MAVHAYGTIVSGVGDVGSRVINTTDGEMYGLGLFTIDPPGCVGAPCPDGIYTKANECPVKFMFRNVESLDVMMNNLLIVREFLVKKEIKEKENECTV